MYQNYFLGDGDATYPDLGDNVFLGTFLDDEFKFLDADVLVIDEFLSLNVSGVICCPFGDLIGVLGDFEGVLGEFVDALLAFEGEFIRISVLSRVNSSRKEISSGSTWSCKSHAVFNKIFLHFLMNL